uniref:SHSP domain-containing protein n=1 Tax=Parastrongyloides trichosuri TaxID=131310 RepID=A0A0N4Z949_PARTI
MLSFKALRIVSSKANIQNIRTMHDHWRRRGLPLCTWRDDFFAPFERARRMFDEMDRMFPPYSRGIGPGERYKFGEGCDEITNKDGVFSIKMDVSHFSPDELKVDVADRTLIIEGKHEEKSDNYGTIKRNFVRKYLLPEGIKAEDVTSELSKDGFLTIQAKSDPALEDKKVKNVPIDYK